MTHYTAWQNGRLVRRRITVIGQSDLAAWASLALVALAIVLMSACGGAVGAEEPVAAQGEPAAEALPETPVAVESAPAVESVPAIMYVNPVPSGDADKDDDLMLLTLRVIERVHARTGAAIEISETGIPVSIHDGGSQGRAVSDHFCFGGGCTAANVSIYISSETLARIYVDNFADNALAHEFVHVLSGWGQCSTEDVDGHLTPGHIVSNGNEGYGQMSWTDADTRLACSCGACLDRVAHAVPELNHRHVLRVGSCGRKESGRPDGRRR